MKHVASKNARRRLDIKEVDEKLLGKLYTKIFPEENLAETLEGNDYESFGARLELRHFRSVK